MLAPNRIASTGRHGKKKAKAHFSRSTVLLLVAAAIISISLTAAKAAPKPQSGNTVGLDEISTDVTTKTIAAGDKIVLDGATVVPAGLMSPATRLPVKETAPVVPAEKKVAVAKKTASTRSTASTVAATKPSGSSASWRSARVSWYGPGFYGNRTASGSVLTQNSMIVAHKLLPFGTRVEFSYNGKTCIGVVADRGPYVSGREFDLGPGVASALGFGGVHTIQYRIL